MVACFASPSFAGSLLDKLDQMDRQEASPQKQMPSNKGQERPAPSAPKASSTADRTSYELAKEKFAKKDYVGAYLECALVEPNEDGGKCENINGRICQEDPSSCNGHGAVYYFQRSAGAGFYKGAGNAALLLEKSDQEKAKKYTQQALRGAEAAGDQEYVRAFQKEHPNLIGGSSQQPPAGKTLATVQRTNGQTFSLPSKKNDDLVLLDKFAYQEDAQTYCDMWSLGQNDVKKGGIEGVCNCAVQKAFSRFREEEATQGFLWRIVNQKASEAERRIFETDLNACNR